MELALAGVCGYYCRSTPMTWADCQRIEAVRVEVLARRGLCAETPRAAVYLPGEAGGMGHMHAYQYASAAYIDQFHRALSGGVGEPARVAVGERAEPIEARALVLVHHRRVARVLRNAEARLWQNSPGTERFDHFGAEGCPCSEGGVVVG